MPVRPTVVSERPLTDGSAVDLRPAWAPDGRAVVFERQQDGRSRLFRLALDETEALDETAPVALDACNTHAETVQGRAAFLGPEAFAFVSDRAGRSALWHDREGVVRRLTAPDERASDYGPAPFDGGVVFFRSRGDAPRLVHLGPGGAERDLGQPGDQPWPLSGGGLVFHSDRDGDAVWRLDAPGGEAVRLTPGGETEGTAYVTPFPSPDGAWVAFARDDGRGSQIWLMRRDGSGRHALTCGDTPSSFPAWSPDGRALVVVRGRPTADADPSGNLWRLDLST